MIPITQTKVVVNNAKGEQVVRGNCYAAAIASMLEMPITEVPNVETLFHIDNSLWDMVMNEWLSSKGFRIKNAFEYACFHKDIYEDIFEKDYNSEHAIELRNDLATRFYLVSGDSPRGVSHICIYRNGKLVHDPHPSRDGLITIKTFQIIEPI